MNIYIYTHASARSNRRSKWYTLSLFLSAVALASLRRLCFPARDRQSAARTCDKDEKRRKGEGTRVAFPSPSSVNADYGYAFSVSRRPVVFKPSPLKVMTDQALSGGFSRVSTPIRRRQRVDRCDATRRARFYNVAVAPLVAGSYMYVYVATASSRMIEERAYLLCLRREILT